MKKQPIDVFACADQILTGVKNGALLTTKADSKVNTMTISWGTMGIEWNKPIFITFVREHRLTREMLDTNPEFTVNLPVADSDKKIGRFCGTNSGRDMDKIQAMNLTLVEADEVSVPAIAEYPLTLECRLMYRQPQEAELIPQAIRERHYPENVDSTAPLANKDYHTAYYGEIVKAYRLVAEDSAE